MQSVKKEKKKASLRSGEGGGGVWRFTHKGKFEC